MKQRLLIMTFLYNPAVVCPETLYQGVEPLTRETLLAGLNSCLEARGILDIRSLEAYLVRIEPSIPEAAGPEAAAAEWVGVNFVPVEAVAEEAEGVIRG